MIDIYALAKNPLVFQKQRTITSAYIDVSGKMGLAQTVLMVQDNITENFGSIKMDNFAVKEMGGFWVVSRAKFKFLKRPYWRDKVVTTSFPADTSSSVSTRTLPSPQSRASPSFWPSKKCAA